ncbi:psbP domain-containing protein 3, chloroplastic isoform X2 [Mangifera indica]|uniref:psbP domain-containing protein 3, chloroplastic isoform X2 n=1 Tax=Mangifera indica TaxID=29780 RepID=UPI001CFA3237|nr:psbP domain-containing protein 3, chloroplastic isoform X2 [Mangifera indica]
MSKLNAEFNLKAMASISSVYSMSLRPRDGSFSPFQGIGKCKKQKAFRCKNYCKKQEQPEEETPVFRVLELEKTQAKRREVVLQLAFTAFSFPAIVPSSLAENGDFRSYTDDANKFKIWIPQDWQVGLGDNGFKSITAFYPAEDSSSNVSVVITGLGPDFTRMESFGKVEEFADTLVSGLDRSWQRPPGVKAELVDCKASKGFYYIEYTLQNPGESCKHLFSAIGMASNGWYNRLYTVTGQFVEENSEKYSSKIEKAVASFRFI